MAKRTEQDVFLALAKAYQHGVETGSEKVSVHVEWLGEALEYLDGKNTGKEKIFVHIDDLSSEELEQLFLPLPTIEETEELE